MNSESSRRRHSSSSTRSTASHMRRRKGSEHGPQSYTASPQSSPLPSRRGDWSSSEQDSPTNSDTSDQRSRSLFPSPMARAWPQYTARGRSSRGRRAIRRSRSSLDSPDQRSEGSVADQGWWSAERPDRESLA